MMDEALMTVKLRDGSSAELTGRGILGGIWVGRFNGRTISWHRSGRWRWDDQDSDRDIIEGLPGR